MQLRNRQTKLSLSRHLVVDRLIMISAMLSSGVLGLLLIALLCPPVVEDTHAEENMPPSITPASLSVSLQHGVDFHVSPASQGNFGTGSARLSVVTNNTSGYSIFMSAKDGNTSLVSTTGGKVPTVASERTSSAFDINTWGYYLGKEALSSSTKYRAMPATADDAVLEVKLGDTRQSFDTYTLAFGAKIGTDLPTGEYKNNVVVSVIANPETITSLTQLTSMQEMTAEICQSTPEHAEKQLIDDRDGNKYFVTKMKDGNCWMTQNLALNINAAQGVMVSPADGSAPYAWKGAGNGTNNLPKDTETTVPTAVSGGGPQTDTRSWNLGKYVLSNPSDGTSCTVNAGESISKCTRFIDVSGAEWNANGTSFQAQTDASGNIIAYDATAKTYDPHYLIGNYYQYNTATAGTGAAVTTDGANASASICPAGGDGNWVLPLSGAANNNVSGSFYNLLNQYNATSGTTGATNIVQLPLAFVRSGYVSIYYGYVNAVGSHGYVWSRASVSATSAYNLYSSPTDVGPSGSGVRYYGRSLRCLFISN